MKKGAPTVRPSDDVQWVPSHKEGPRSPKRRYRRVRHSPTVTNFSSSICTQFRQVPPVTHLSSSIRPHSHHAPAVTHLSSSIRTQFCQAPPVTHLSSSIYSQTRTALAVAHLSSSIRTQFRQVPPVTHLSSSIRTQFCHARPVEFALHGLGLRREGDSLARVGRRSREEAGLGHGEAFLGADAARLACA